MKTPADLAGRKIRTQESPSAIALVKTLGAAATPIAWGELYTALQQGVVDGAENNAPSYWSSGHYEVAPYYSLDAHTAVPDVLLVATTLWNRLETEERAWLEAAAAESVIVQRRLWADARDAALAAVEAGGATILRPDPHAFAAATETLREALREDPELAPLLRRIDAVRP